jgi:hypothetical protein
MLPLFLLFAQGASIFGLRINIIMWLLLRVGSAAECTSILNHTCRTERLGLAALVVGVTLLSQWRVGYSCES